MSTTPRHIWTALLLALLILTAVCDSDTTFFTIELERLIERAIPPRIAASPDVETMNRDTISGVDRFILPLRHVPVIVYTCCGLVVFLAIVGLVVERRVMAVGQTFITSC